MFPALAAHPKMASAFAKRWGHFYVRCGAPRYLAALIRHLRGRLSALSLLCCSGLTLLLRLSVLR